jgi:hypothetical protein
MLRKMAGRFLVAFFVLLPPPLFFLFFPFSEFILFSLADKTQPFLLGQLVHEPQIQTRNLEENQKRKTTRKKTRYWATNRSCWAILLLKSTMISFPPPAWILWTQPFLMKRSLGVSGRTELAYEACTLPDAKARYDSLVVQTNQSSRRPLSLWGSFTVVLLQQSFYPRGEGSLSLRLLNCFLLAIPS